MTRKGESSLPFLLSRIGLAISVPVFAHVRRKYLQPLPHVLASVLASTCGKRHFIGCVISLWLQLYLHGANEACIFAHMIYHHLMSGLVNGSFGMFKIGVCVTS